MITINIYLQFVREKLLFPYKGMNERLYVFFAIEILYRYIDLKIYEIKDVVFFMLLIFYLYVNL
jgi:hypothetical protein